MTQPNSLSQPPARLDFEAVGVSYHNQLALSQLTFQVPHGSQVAVVGPNGAGKSTLFKALVGLLPIQTGRILVHAQPLNSHKDCVAYVPQREEVDWRFPVTVSDVVMMGRFGRLGWFKPPSAEDHRIVKQCLNQMDIGHLAKRAIGDLSGGQQQRVFLARALAQEPHILLMDEPFTGVDITTQQTTLGLLEELRKKKVTVLVSTHDLNMAAERFELVLLLNRRLIAFGPPAEVFRAENIRQAFGGQMLVLDSAVVIDDCCHGHDLEEQEESQAHPEEDLV